MADIGRLDFQRHGLLQIRRCAHGPVLARHQSVPVAGDAEPGKDRFGFVLTDDAGALLQATGDVRGDRQRLDCVFGLRFEALHETTIVRHRRYRSGGVGHAGQTRKAGPCEQRDGLGMGEGVGAEDDRLIDALAEARELLELRLHILREAKGASDQHRVDAGGRSDQLEHRRVAELEDHLGGHVHRIPRAAIGGQQAIDGIAGLLVQGWHLQPMGFAHIGEPDAGATGWCENGNPLAPGQAVAKVGKTGGHIDHLIHVPPGDDAVAPEHGLVGARRSGKRCGVRSCRPGAGVGAADLGNQQRLVGRRCPGRHAGKLRGGPKAFHEHDQRVGILVAQEVVDDVEPFQPRLVAHADHEAEAQLLGASAIEKREAHPAALGNHGDAAGGGIRRCEAVFQIENRGAEGCRERCGGVHEPLAVGTQHRHVVALHRRADGLLAGGPVLATLLGEARADDDCCAHAALTAGLHCFGNIPGRYGDDGQIHGLGQRRHGSVGGEAVDAIVAAAHGVQRAVETVLTHGIDDAPADPAFVGRCADQCDGPGPEKRVEIGHGTGVASAGPARGR